MVSVGEQDQGRDERGGVSFKRGVGDAGLVIQVDKASEMSQVWETSECQGALSSGLPLSTGDAFQDPRWMPEAWMLLSPVCTVFFLYIQTYDKLWFINSSQEEINSNNE